MSSEYQKFQILPKKKPHKFQFPRLFESIDSINLHQFQKSFKIKSSSKAMRSLSGVIVIPLHGNRI